MAKKYASAAQLVPFRKLMFVPSINAVRKYGGLGTEAERKETRASLAQDGWWESATISCDEIDGTTWNIDGHEVDLTTFRDQEIANRQLEWDGLKAQSHKDPQKYARSLEVFEKIFVVNGKIDKPEFLPIVCNRRGAEFVQAMVERSYLTDGAKLDAKGKEIPGTGTPLELNFNVPISVKDWANQTARLTEQLRENEGATKGKLETDPVDCIIAARDLVAQGWNQNKIRNLFRASNGVRAYQIVMLDAEFPSVKIIERMQYPPEKEGYIHARSVKYPLLQSMAQRLTPEDLTAQNLKLNAKGQASLGLCDLAEVEKFFSNIGKDDAGNNTSKVMGKDEMGRIAKVNKNPFTKTAYETAAVNGDRAKLNKAELFAEPCEDLIALEDAGDLPGAVLILSALRKMSKGERAVKEEEVFKLLGIKSFREQAAPEPKGKGEHGKSHAKAGK
jgi:hypothetical protein